MDLNIYTGAGQVTRMMHLLNTGQYMVMRHEAFANDSLQFPSISANPSDQYYDVNGVWDTTRNTNWQKVLIGNTANFTNAQGSVSGGNANTQFVVGGGFSKQGTAFLGNFSDEKASTHFSLTHNSEDQRFHLQLGVNYVYDNSDLPPVDFTNYIALAPDAPLLYTSDGNINWQNYSGSPTFYNNPAQYTVIKYFAATHNLISNLNLSYQILPGLQFKSSFGYNRDEMTQNQINPSTSNFPPYNTYSILRSLNYVYTVFNGWILEPQLIFQRHVGRSHFDALVGSTFEDRDQNSIAQNAYGFSSDALITNPAASSYQKIKGANNVVYHYNALYGRLGYNWSEKYLVNLTARRDGSSRFGPGKQFGDFGAVGVGWIFSRENFIQDNTSFLSFGKLRASYGSTGNDQIQDYQYLSTYSANSSTYQGIGGLYPTRLTNPDLAWELVKKLEAGIELGFLKDRILVSTSYFRNRTGNQLVGFALPVFTGFGSVGLNLPAVVQNTGWELTLNTINIKSKNFNWTSSANLSVPSNKLVSFPNLQNFGAYNTTYVVGKSLFIQELYHSTGVNTQTGLYSFATKDGSGVPSFPQDLIATRPVTQNYYGGLDNNFNYKGFALDVFVQYVNQLGYNYKNYFIPPGFGYTYSNEPTAVLNRWTYSGQLTSTQRFGTENGPLTHDSYNTFTRSDGIITGASFLRVKNVSFSYQFPRQWLKSLSFQSVRLYLQGQNLLTITKYLGLDPETSGLNLPPLRMLTAGLQVIL